MNGREKQVVSLAVWRRRFAYGRFVKNLRQMYAEDRARIVAYDRGGLETRVAEEIQRRKA